jgi:hypothetical protein
MAKKKFNILQWNSRSLLPKITEFKNMLSLHNISITAISETWLLPDFHMNLSHILRDDCADGRGGTALFIHNSLPFTPIQIKHENFPFQIVGALVKQPVELT